MDHEARRDRRCGVYYEKQEVWRDEQLALREVALDSGLTEVFKWRAPAYALTEGGNVCIVGGYGGAAVLSFFKGALLDDPEGLLEPPGPNSRAARTARFPSVAAIEAARPALLDLIARAAENERQGLKVDLPPDDFDLPEELAEALEADPPLREAFEALTPGRRRGWVIHISGAKQSATRARRVEKARDAILDGKGLHD